MTDTKTLQLPEELPDDFAHPHRDHHPWVTACAVAGGVLLAVDAAALVWVVISGA